MGIFGPDNQAQENASDELDLNLEEEEGVQAPEEDASEGQSNESVPEAAEEAAPAEPEQPQLILGKFKDAQELARSYQELERKLGEQGSTIGQLESQLQAAARLFQQLQLQAAQQRPAAQGQAPQQGEIVFDWDKFAENPQATLNAFVNAKLEQRLTTASQQLMQQLAPLFGHVQTISQYLTKEQLDRHFAAQRQAMEAKYPDFAQYRAKVAAIFDEIPQLAELPNAYEQAYSLVKQRETAMAQAAPPPQREAEKRAARMPKGAAPKAPAPQDPEQAFLERVFGPMSQKQGIFGGS